MASRRVRLIVFGVMVLVALVSVWLIDRRAVVRMHEGQPSRHMPSPLQVSP